MNDIPWSAEEKNTAELEDEIRRTRARLSDDIDAISEKLSPAHLKQRARDAMKGAQEAVMTTVRNAVSEVGQKTREASTAVAESVRAHPVRAAAIGAGVAGAAGATWYVVNKRRNGANGAGRIGNGASSYDGTYGDGFPGVSGPGSSDTSRIGGAIDTAKEKAGELASTAAERMGRAREAAAQRARRAGEGISSFYRENPLAAATGLLALGVAIGALIPRTRRENALMGETRDELVDRAGQVAQHARETFRSTLTGPAGSDGRSVESTISSDDSLGSSESPYSSDR